MDDPQLSDDEREQQFWRAVLRVLWTVVIVLLGLGLLAALVALAGWRQDLFLCLLGLLAGAALAVAVLGSVKSRELTGLVLGAVTLPLLAGYLGVSAVTNQSALDAYGARFLPFLVSAATALLAALAIAGVWRGRRRPMPPAEAARTPEQGALP